MTILGFDWTSQFSLSVLKSLDQSNLNVESGLGLGRLYQTWLATRSPDAGGDKDPTFQVLIFYLVCIKLLPIADSYNLANLAIAIKIKVGETTLNTLHPYGVKWWKS